MALICIDFDDTIASGHVHNSISNNPDNFVARYTPYDPHFEKNQGLERAQWEIAKAIRPAGDANKWKNSIETLLREGHNVAITSYTKYPHMIERYLREVIKIDPALMSQIKVVGDYPKKNYPTIKPGTPSSRADDMNADDDIQNMKNIGKSQHIDVAIEHFKSLGKTFTANDVFLIDDNADNVRIANIRGHIGIQAGKGFPANANIIEAIKADPEYARQFSGTNKAPENRMGTIPPPREPDNIILNKALRILWQETVGTEMKEKKILRATSSELEEISALYNNCVKTLRTAFASAELKNETREVLMGFNSGKKTLDDVFDKIMTLETSLQASTVKQDIHAVTPPPSIPKTQAQPQIMQPPLKPHMGYIPPSHIAQLPPLKPFASIKEVKKARNDAIKTLIADVSRDKKLSSSEKHELKKMISALKDGLRGRHNSLEKAQIIPEQIIQFKKACNLAAGLIQPLVAAKKSGHDEAIHARHEIYEKIKSFQNSNTSQLKTQITGELQAAVKHMQFHIRHADPFDPKSRIIIGNARKVPSKEQPFIAEVAKLGTSPALRGDPHKAHADPSKQKYPNFFKSPEPQHKTDTNNQPEPPKFKR